MFNITQKSLAHIARQKEDAFNILKDKCEKLNFLIIGSYVDSKTRIELICSCGKKFFAGPLSIKSGATTSCGCGRRKLQLSHDEIEKRFDKNGLKLLEKFKGVSFKLKTQCRCGKIFYLTPDGATSTQSCGCARSNFAKNKKLKDEEIIKRCKKYGIKFLHRTESKYTIKKSHGIFVCRCGKNYETAIYRALCGEAISCGCLSRGENANGWSGYKEIPGSYYNEIKYKRKRRTRMLPFEVTIEYLWDLYIKQNRKCSVSGEEIKFAPKDDISRTVSLDRIDNSKGYIPGNVQWVHKKINVMKWNLGQERFKELARLVHLNQIKKDIK